MHKNKRLRVRQNSIRRKSQPVTVIVTSDFYLERIFSLLSSYPFRTLPGCSHLANRGGSFLGLPEVWFERTLNVTHGPCHRRDKGYGNGSRNAGMQRASLDLNVCQGYALHADVRETLDFALRRSYSLFIMPPRFPPEIFDHITDFLHDTPSCL